MKALEELGEVRPPVEASELLAFWFSERAKKLWFDRNEAFDAEIRARFGALCDRGAQGRLAHWEGAAGPALALVILLDQFPRNMHRGKAEAFACDALACVVAERAIARGFDLTTAWDRRFFFYMPFEHCEDAAGQARSIELFRAWIEAAPAEHKARCLEQFEYVLRHQEIVLRFGRFPHRNGALGRECTSEELEFLKEPRSSF